MLGSDLWVHVRGVGVGGLVFKIVFKIEDINTFFIINFSINFFLFCFGMAFYFHFPSRTEDLTHNVRD